VPGYPLYLFFAVFSHPLGIGVGKKKDAVPIPVARLDYSQVSAYSSDDGRYKGMCYTFFIYPKGVEYNLNRWNGFIILFFSLPNE